MNIKIREFKDVQQNLCKLKEFLTFERFCNSGDAELADGTSTGYANLNAVKFSLSGARLKLFGSMDSYNNQSRMVFEALRTSCLELFGVIPFKIEDQYPEYPSPEHKQELYNKTVQIIDHAIKNLDIEQMKSHHLYL